MSQFQSSPIVPRYHGKSWVCVRLPRKARDWSDGGKLSIASDGDAMADLKESLAQLNQNRLWQFPTQRHYFFSDLHADPEAFADSLVASGGVKRTGPAPADLLLTRQGAKARFVIGGDSFDKGPSNLGLLRVIKHLMDIGAKVRILAGNHDVRLFLGMLAVSKKKDTANEHFFIRTGQKIIPLLEEIRDHYLTAPGSMKGIPGKNECRRRLFPSEGWFERFPETAKGQISDAQIKRELHRISKKHARFESLCEEKGMTIRQVYAAVEKWKELFMKPGGEFAWFFPKMRLAYRRGSFLFVHAGLDNALARHIRDGGIKPLNQAFRDGLEKRPFDFYYGTLCNAIRTKYRPVDRPFSKKGARYIRQAGLSAIVHGHRNLHNGQRISVRKSVLNFECDTSLDAWTRKKEKVRGKGASVTIIEPKGLILGVSSDYPDIKVFDPVKTLHALKNLPEKRRRRP